MGPQNPHSNHSTTNPTLAAQPAGHLGLSSYPAVLICLVNTLWVTIACSQQPHLEVSPHFSTTTNTIASHKMPAGNLCKPSERPVPLAAVLLPFPETTCGKELGPHIPAGPMAAAFRTGSADLEREGRLQAPPGACAPEVTHSTHVTVVRERCRLQFLCWEGLASLSVSFVSMVQAEVLGSVSKCFPCSGLYE